MKRFVCFFLMLSLVLPLAACGSASHGGSTAGNSAAMSPALEILRGQTQLVRCTAKYADLSFSSGDFLALTGESTEYIVINSLPAPETGLLMLNGSAVIAGQTVPVSSLDYLKLVPAAGASAEGNEPPEAVFTFTAKANGWENRELTCVVALLDGENFPPAAEDLTAETFASVACFTSLKAVDPNGDANVTYQITTYPRHGTLSLKGETAVYTPKDGYTGTDTFTYVAVDRYGASSPERTVSISVVKNQTGLSFVDLEGSPVHNAAIRLCADEVMTYRVGENGYLFDPKEPVSKIDCLVMMMCLCGQAEQVSASADTEAMDDGTLTAGKRGFLRMGIAMGAVHLEAGMFNPNDPVTAADAAYMATALLGVPALSAKQPFSDLDATPAWACAALVSADSSGLLSARNGLLDADAILTRADVAQLLENMRLYATGTPSPN